MENGNIQFENNYSPNSASSGGMGKVIAIVLTVVVALGGLGFVGYKIFSKNKQSIANSPRNNSVNVSGENKGNIDESEKDPLAAYKTVDECLAMCGKVDYEKVDEATTKASGTINISIVANSSNCASVCWSREAKIRKDTSICFSKISRKSILGMVEDCIAGVAGEMGDFNVCDQLTDDLLNDLAEEKCFANAEANGLKMPCERALAGGPIFTQLARVPCYEEVAKKKGDSSVCPQLKSPEFIDACYSGVAEGKKDPAICASIKEYRFSCYTKIARIKKDIAICERIEESDQNRHREGCYFQVALSIGDNSICKKIENDKAMRDVCETGVTIH